MLMLGAYVTAEMCNENCPWGGLYSEEQLQNNKQHNQQQIEELIHWLISIQLLLARYL